MPGSIVESLGASECTEEVHLELVHRTDRPDFLAIIVSVNLLFSTGCAKVQDLGR